MKKIHSEKLSERSVKQDSRANFVKLEKKKMGLAKSALVRKVRILLTPSPPLARENLKLAIPPLSLFGINLKGKPPLC